jgi:hypothetical protein
MALKSVVANLSEVPEAFHSEYTEQPGVGFVLAVEGDLPVVSEFRGKVTEFRDNNIKLAKELDGLKQKLTAFDGIDPAKYREVTSRIAELERQGVGRGEDVNALVQRQVNAATQPLLAKLTDIERRESEAKQQLARKNVEGSLRDVASKVGVNEKATADFIRRGLDTFNLEGKAMDGDEPVFSRKNPSLPLSMEEWALELQGEAPHLFNSSTGGGARGGEGGRSSATRYVSSDPLEVGRNLEDIASGKVAVVS